MSTKSTQDFNLYVYVSSIYPWTHINQLNRTYCLMITKRAKFKNITIQPLEYSSNDPRAKGIFVYMTKGQAAEARRFFDDAILKLKRFLNYLTYYCRHGFKEMDNYIYHGLEVDDNIIFDEKILPPIVAISHTYRNMNISKYIRDSLNEADSIRLSEPLKSKIENALFLYRSSFFQENEGMRYILRFTALESLAENSDSAYGDNLVKEIMKAARTACSDKQLPSSDIDKICGHIGQLTKESVRGMIKNTIDKYKITRYDKPIDVDKLYKARNKFVHEGIEVKNLHQLSLALKDIVPNLVSQVIRRHPD